MNKVIVIRKFKGLEPGTELVYDPGTDTYGYEETDEVIGDHIHAVNTKKLSFSNEYVRNLLGNIFENSKPVESLDYKEDVDYIHTLQAEVAELRSILKSIKRKN